MFKGVILLLCAAFLFALATVFVKLAAAAPYFVPPAVATFARFIVGFVIFSASLAVTRGGLKPNNPRAVARRAVLNTTAVILFYAALQYTTVTKSNILNLTYPAFVFLVAPYMTGERQRLREYGYLIATLCGAALIVLGGGSALPFAGVNIGDMLALASGVVSGFAIAGLREAAKYDSPYIILFYQMGFGSAASLLVLLPSFKLPRGRALLYVGIAALVSSIGQYCITRGYRHIGAALGSVVLESGIFFAAVLGISIFRDPLTPTIVLGGLLIIVSIAGIGRLDSVRRK